MAPKPRVVILFDASCGLCGGAVAWLAARDARRALLFAPLQGETARPYLPLAGVPSAPGSGQETLVLVEGAGGPGERIFVRSAAVRRALRHLGGRWALLALFLGALPAAPADAVYRWVSRRRHLLAGAAPARGADPSRLRGRILR